MRILRWLFGKQEKCATTAIEEQSPTNLDERGPMPAEEVSSRPAPDREADNLRRWRESDQPRAWVEAHRGRWDHNAWLALLDELKRSPFWPMHPDAVGLTLEEIQRQRFRQ